MSQVKNLQIHFEICRIYRQDSRWQQIFLIQASKLVVKRRVSKHRTVSPVIPQQTKHSWPRNLKYNREHIGANPRWHVTDLKASKHDPKAFPSTVLSFLSNQPTKVFRSKSSLSLCAFHNGSFLVENVPHPFPHRSNPRFALDTNSLEAANSAKKGLRGVDEEAMQRWQCGKRTSEGAVASSPDRIRTQTFNPNR